MALEIEMSVGYAYLNPSVRFAVVLLLVSIEVAREERNMGDTMAVTDLETYASISPSEAKELVGFEIKALRKAAEKSADPSMLLFLDFMEASQDGWNKLLELALNVSARLAAAEGLSQRQWMQQLLSRHAVDRNRVEALWRELVDLLERGQLPWSA